MPRSKTKQLSVLEGIREITENLTQLVHCLNLDECYDEALKAQTLLVQVEQLDLHTTPTTAAWPPSGTRDPNGLFEWTELPE